MSAPPYMKFFWGDYHKATRHLTRDQHGAYFLLLGEAWRLGGSLPDDDRMLAAWALCTPAEWSGMKQIVTDFFSLRRGKWVHDRVREELASYESTSRKRKEAGRKGGLVSVGKDKGNLQAIARQKPTKPEPEPYNPKAPLGADLFEDEKPEPVAKPDDGISAAVDAIWAEAPKPSRQRSSRADVARAMASAVKRGSSPPEVIAGLAGYFASDAATKDGGAFVKGVHRMIEQDRWREFSPADAAPTEPQETPADAWRRRVMIYRKNGHWNRLEWGPSPGKPGCTVAPEILMAEGFTPTKAPEVVG
ncbi:MAG: DUF1376 domain-containing protein [Alphaproteobacteria bacterium]